MSVFRGLADNWAGGGGGGNGGGDGEVETWMEEVGGEGN